MEVFPIESLNVNGQIMLKGKITVASCISGKQTRLQLLYCVLNTVSSNPQTLK